MSAQVHPHGKEGQETDEESPEQPQSSEKLSGLNAGQIELKASKQMRMLCAGIMLAFSFVDLLGSVLFMPAVGALCQRAEGGPSASMGILLLLPSGALETEDMKGLVLGTDSMQTVTMVPAEDEECILATYPRIKHCGKSEKWGSVYRFVNEEPVGDKQVWKNKTCKCLNDVC